LQPFYSFELLELIVVDQKSQDMGSTVHEGIHLRPSLKRTSDRLRYHGGLSLLGL